MAEHGIEYTLKAAGRITPVQRRGSVTPDFVLHVNLRMRQNPSASSSTNSIVRHGDGVQLVFQAVSWREPDEKEKYNRTK